MVEPVGITLGAIGVFATLLDTCNRAYAAVQIMKSFGQDFQTLWRRLHGRRTQLFLLMSTDSADLERPPRPDDPLDETTKAISEQLEELALQFEECEKLIAASVGKLRQPSR